MARSIVNTARYSDDDEALGDLLDTPRRECNVGHSVEGRRRYRSGRMDDGMTGWSAPVGFVAAPGEAAGR